MTDLSIASVAPIESLDEAGDLSFKIIVLFSFAGLAASLCLMTLGIDLGAGWI